MNVLKVIDKHIKNDSTEHDNLVTFIDVNREVIPNADKIIDLLCRHETETKRYHAMLRTEIVELLKRGK